MVSLDRPYGGNGASMFLTYERNAIKLAEQLGIPLAYVTSMDIATVRTCSRGPARSCRSGTTSTGRRRNGPT